MRTLTLEDVLTYPSTILILGDIETGKTVTAFACAEHWRKEGYWIGYLDKVKNLPKWIHDVSSETLELPKGERCVLIIDDAHEQYYAQDFKIDPLTKKLDIMNRARRHTKGCSVIYTTQDSTSLKKPLLRMANIIFFKQPPLLEEMDRPEIRKLYQEADQELEKVNYNVQYAYVITKKKKGLTRIPLPSWYNKGISEGDTRETKNDGVMAKLGRIVYNSIRNLGA